MGYEPRLPLRYYQARALAKARGRRAFAYLMEFGTGKSCVLLAEWGELVEAGEVDDLLIFAPAGCYRNWDRDRSDEQIAEINKHLSPDLRERLMVGVFQAGMGVGKTRALEAFMRVTGRPRLLLINLEAMSSVKMAQEIAAQFCDRGRAMVAVDEATRIKTWDSAVTNHVIRSTRRALYRRIMTGLVSPNGPMDLYAQFEFLDWRIMGHQSFFSFRQRYAVLKDVQHGGRVMRNASGDVMLHPDGKFAGTPVRVNSPGCPRVVATKVIVAYRNEDELAAKLERHSFRCLKADVLTELPPKTYSTWDVAMTPEQARVYREMREQALSQLDCGEWVSAQFPLTMVAKLHHILCGHVRDDMGNVTPIASNRLKSLMEILELRQGKTIIWANYDFSIREIADELERRYGEGSVARYWGGNRGTRHEDEARFLRDDKCRYIVSTQQSGGAGNTWTVADCEVYYSSSHNLEHRLNSEDRPHRFGQKSAVDVIDMVVQDTVDVKILEALRKKIDLSCVINRDNYREWVI